MHLIESQVRPTACWLLRVLLIQGEPLVKRTQLIGVASLALVPLLLVSPLSGQPPGQKGDTIEQEVRKIDKAEATAMLAGDLPAIEKYWAEDFTVNAPNNQVLKGKKDAIRLM